MITAENFDFVERQIFSMSGEQRRSIFDFLSDLVKKDDDPFYGDANMARLKAAVASVAEGNSTLKEHDLIEA